jgi:hypothetical protein
MSSNTTEPIATAIGSVDIALAGPADLDDVLDILSETARWLTSRGINQWVDGFPREMIAADISRGEVSRDVTGAQSAPSRFNGTTSCSGPALPVRRAMSTESQCGARRAAWASNCSRWQNE